METKTFDKFIFGGKSLNRNDIIPALNAGVATSAELIFENSKTVCEWLGTEKAAAFLDMTPNALRIMVHRGKVKVYRIGRRLRFKLTDLRALLQRKGS